MNKRIAFISDLHLSEARPEITQCFFDFVREQGDTLSALYILGDLFDAYIGDDDRSPLQQAVRYALLRLNQEGVKVYLQLGNRDFLLGAGFGGATGVVLLDEYAVVDLGGQRVLLTHGDLLCTDDVKYQTARARIRTPEWKRNALSKPLWIRKLYACWYRYRSGVDKSKKTQYVMDVNQAAVIAALEQHNVTALIHGHTHRPGMHRLSVHGKPARRFVLGEWNPGGAVLYWTLEGGFKL
ncbi:UDP-2,3-diacylglucosamine diphosphatase [Candidatus Methylospira mobilis]|uniref:UDP-2,3-diacylglucosamine hydrolase n=1 Tax=Candidatus Methylospira mobilis TaxID=1808979 RepID=A0A5Q0BI18_9GAMM|nr:UDP-2,3-diacylglucosamine diphosphatase [Candidatus Methylospira mobilis]QFY41851.1 UDP-2,3-diacylglucosamine diphosphatase [Candidatus Methylospira mobilis]WNV06723.1 UDP-2,3-diacylglucosamine diphosphatase [Candidatus Methylospira mobilis]